MGKKCINDFDRFIGFQPPEYECFFPKYCMHLASRVQIFYLPALYSATEEVTGKTNKTKSKQIPVLHSISY
jgi:hypothetical protein